MSQQSRLGGFGNLPDAEKAQDVVDTVGVEIASHHLQAALPPSVAVLGHCLPVVGRKAPILTLGGEVVGRRAHLLVKVEQIGMRFHVHAFGIHANGDVAFQQQALIVQGFDGLTQLLVAVVLQEKVDFQAIAVALGAKLGVVVQPVFVFFCKLLEISGFFQNIPLLFKSDLEVFPFGFQHFRIIDNIGFVERCSCTLESRVFLDVQLFEVQVNRIQCKGRDGIVRIGIAPVVVCRRVVDG